MIHAPFYLIFILSLFQFSESKAQNIKYASTIPVEQYRIIIDHAQGGTVRKLIDEISYTPLEIRDKRDIFQSVFHIAITGNSIGILSFQNESPRLFIYSTDGKLINNVDYIKSSGIPKSEGILSLKGWDDHFILSSENYKIKVDSKGNNIVLLHEHFVRGDSIRIGESIWTYTTYDSIASPKVALALNDKPIIGYTEKKNKYFIDKNAYFSPVSTPHGLSYFCPDNHYKIFELNESEITKIIDFVFPKNSIMDTSVFYHSWSEFTKQKKSMEKISTLDNFIRFGDYLIFRTDNVDYYGFNLITNDFIGFSNIIPDVTQDYMDFMSNYPVLSDDKYLYTLIHPMMIRYAEDKCKEEGHKMREEYQKLRDHRNLILVRFKLKS